MTYQATWTNGNSQGRVEGGIHRVRLCDASELAAAINRRRLLTYQSPDDFSGFIAAGAAVHRSLLYDALGLPFDDFRDNVCHRILEAPVETTPGDPPTPTAMQWLWPQTGDDENKVIVGGNPGVGQVGLFDKLNGASTWTDPALSAGATNIRAVHWNELRQSVEWLSRGRWTLPLYFSGGLFSMLPDTPWFGGAIANNGYAELRTVGFAILRTADQPAQGLANVTVRSSSYLEIDSDADCAAEVHHCLRPIDFLNDRPSWNQYAPGDGRDWSAPGGTGAGDSTLVGAINLSQSGPVRLGGGAMTAAIQAMVDGAEQNLLLRQTDTGYQTAGVSGRLVVEFDLACPPN